MSSSTDPQRCGNCNKSPADEPNLKLQACGRCKDKYYCNSACQSAAWPFHKANCKRPNYTLTIHLCPDHISDPDVTRILSVPASTTFANLHEALQIAFGWANTHAYDFAVQDPEYEEKEGEVDSIMDHINKTMKYDRNGDAFDESDSREFMVRISAQEGFVPGYKVDKMHEGTRKHPRCVEKDSKKMKVFQLFDDAEYNGKSIEYMYDFGDNWKHIITVTGRTKAGDNIVCLGGTGHGVAEDAGGVQGWKNLKEAYRAPKPNKEQREKKQWYESRCSNSDPEGLGGDRIYEWSKELVNRHLAARRL